MIRILKISSFWGNNLSEKILATLIYFIFLIPLGAISAEELQYRTAIDVTSLGPQVGELVPDFSLPDQTGQLQTLESILGPNGAILLFHRSADW